MRNSIEVLKALVVPPSVWIRAEVQKKVSERLVPEYEIWKKILSLIQEKFWNTFWAETLLESGEAFSSPYTFTDLEAIDYLRHNLEELWEAFLFSLYSRYFIDKNTKKLKKRTQPIRDKYAEIAATPKWEIYNAWGKEILERARQWITSQEFAQWELLKLMDAYERKGLESFWFRVSKQMFQKLHLDIFSTYWLEIFSSWEKSKNFHTLNSSEIVNFFIYGHEELLVFSNFFFSRLNFFDDSSSKESYSPQQKTWWESEDFVVSAQQNFILLQKLTASWNLFEKYFPWEEKDILFQIFTLQKVLWNLLSREKILDKYVDYEEKYKFLVLIFTLKNLIDTHKTLFKPIHSLERMYEFLFWFSFHRDSLNLYHNSRFEKATQSNSKLTSKEKVHLSSVVIAGYKYFLTDKLGDEPFEPFFVYVDNILKNEVKIESIIQFFLASQKCDSFLSLEQLLFVFKKDLETLPYIHTVIYKYFDFFSEYFAHWYHLSFLEKLSLDEFLFLAWIENKESQRRILVWEQSLESYKTGKNLVSRLQENLAFLPLHHPIVEAYNIRIFSKSSLLLSEILSEISELEKTFPHTWNLINYYKTYGHSQEDKLYLEAILSLGLSEEMEGVIIVDFFSLNSYQKGIIFLMIKKVSSDFFFRFPINFSALFSSKDFPLFYDCLIAPEFDAVFFEEVFAHIYQEILSNILQREGYTVKGENYLGNMSMSSDYQEKFSQFSQEIKREMLHIYDTITLKSDQELFLEFLYFQDEVSLFWLKRVYALLTFFAKFWIHNFHKIGKIFEFCFENDDIQERVQFLYSRILDYELDDGEEKDFKDVIMNYIKHGNQKVLDDYFFTQEELDDSGISSPKIVWKIIPLFAPEVIRKVLRLGYIENSKGWGHRTFFKEGSSQKIIVPYSRKNRLSKFTLRWIIEKIWISLDEWNLA